MSERDRAQGPLKEAILAAQSGRTPEARRLLTALVQQNPRDATAWLWLGNTLDDPAKRRDCFTRALQLDPGNEAARRGMIALLSGPSATGEAARPGGETPAAAPADDTGPAAPRQITAHPFPCPGCGANLRYDIGRRALHCAHCGSTHPVPAPTRAVEWLGMPPDLSGPEAQGELIRREALRCRSCGATTEFSARTASLACPYCGSPQVVRCKGAVYLIPPRALIPFAVDEKDAKQALRAWLAAGYWHPDKLVQEAELVELHSLYLPFWGFKGLGEVTYQLQGSSLALDTLPRGSGQQKRHIAVPNLLIPGAFTINARIQRQIEPFDLDQAVPFRPEYLAGWPAEVYQVALADATIEARGRMSQEARNKAYAYIPTLSMPVDNYNLGGIPINIGGQSRGRNRQVSYAPTVATVHLDSFMHYVLPVWIGAYRYRGQNYHFAVNGQTGKAGGEAPRGGTIGILTIALGAAAIVLVGLLLWRFGPAILALLQRPAQATPADPPKDVRALMYLGTLILVVFVLTLMSVAARWKQIKAWFRKGSDREQHH